MILNLTQHEATPEQIAAGVVEPDDGMKASIREALTFNDLPSASSVFGRAIVLAQIARQWADEDYTKVMIGGAPFLMWALEQELRKRRLEPIYAFSKRVVLEEEDGVKKTIFRHEGFVNALS